jgi:signal peptidase I
MSEEPKSENRVLPQKSFKKQAWDNILSMGSAILLVFVIRSSVIEAFKIPSGSMIPTLLVGDQIFVNKFAYGLRVPLTDWIGSQPLYFFKNKGPARGDIIVFRYPVDPDIYFIKRVIGLPGDKIEMKDKVVYVNGKPFDRKPLSEAENNQIFNNSLEDSGEYPKERMSIFHDRFDNETATIMIDKQSYFSINFDPVTVPEGQYFVMGDNRDNSKDSRFWGFVPFENIKGKAFIVWLSIWIDFDNPSKSTHHFDRIGTILH